MLVPMQLYLHIVFENYFKRHLAGKHYFAVENLQVIAEGHLVNHFLRLEHNIFCTTTRELGNLAFEAAEISHFSHKLNQDRTRSEEMVLRIHEMISTTKYKAVTCQMKSRAEGFSKEKLSELFNWSESIVNSKLIVLDCMCTTYLKLH